MGLALPGAIRGWLAARAVKAGRVAVVTLGVTSAVVWLSALRGGTIAVPNASFESPVTPFVSIAVEAWQDAPKPPDYDESGGYLWNQLTGVFKNTPVGSSDHIENCDGLQAAWLFAVPEVALFQHHDPTISPSFDVRFEPGQSYQLTVGVIGAGGNMREGVTLELSLYYRDDSGNAVTVGAGTVTNRVATFPTRNHFVDFSVRVTEVQPENPWAGRHLGIGLRSMVSAESQGGFWDLDNVRLESFRRPSFRAPAWREGQFEATLESEPGAVLEILATSALGAPTGIWVALGSLTNETGAVRFTDPDAGNTGRLYQARVVP